MKNTLKFEIILVYYKRPQIVLNALDSIKQLQYENWHLTFIDDSGDDSFKDTLLQYGLDNKNISYIASFDSEEMKKEQGGSRHGYFMNEAIYASDSDIVVILCDDDAIIDGYFEYLNDYYQLNPEINWAYSKLLFFDPTTQHYSQASANCKYSHPGSTYTLNYHEQPLVPMGKLDGSQITFRTKVFTESKLGYAYPQTRGLDADIFRKIVEKYGLCYPTYVYGQCKGAFADQLGNRWVEKGDEFKINMNRMPIMLNNISLLVGLKNNLDYNKHFYITTRELYPDVEICFVSYGSIDSTHEWLDSLQDENLKYFYSEENKTFSDTFNKAAELATKEYVAYLHNDIVLAPNFLENILKHVGPSSVVSYTTIEPPIFAGHERPGKIIHDLGTELKTFDKQKLYNFVNQENSKYSDKIEPGITFFMCMPRKKLLEIGGMDNLFNPMFCEDDDLINRWELLGMNCFTSLDAICYHFVSKTSRFSEEYQSRTQEIEVKSNRNYIRKWGSRLKSPKYDIGFIIKNCNPQLLELLEPWCSTLYTDCDYKKYIEKEQSNTKFDLYERIKPFDNEKQNEILVEFDGSNFMQSSFEIIQKLSEIIKHSGSVGIFELDIFRIEIVQMNEYQNKLIICQ